MQVYSNSDLANMHLQQQAEEAFEQGIVSEQSFNNIKKAYPHNLYTPAFFIRVALGLLCIVCVSFGTFLLFLFMNGLNSIIGIFFLMFIGCYGLLEYMVKTKNYYNAGIDNVLQVFTIIFFAGMFADGNYMHQDIIICIAVFIAAVWLSLRFADAFMALTAFAALLACVYLMVGHKNGFSYYLPFLCITVASLTYWLQKSLSKKDVEGFYKRCFDVLKIAALVTCYAATNVFVNNMVQSPAINLDGSFIKILWILNTLIPLAYLAYGFKKKDITFLRTGFLGIVATIITIHFFYSVLNTETALIAGGIILIIIGYVCIKYFKNDRYGFTSKAYSTLHKNLINLQTLISLQVGSKHAPQQNVQFGGGSSGGAGASGNW